MLTRRDFLTVAAAVGAAGLAGCAAEPAAEAGPGQTGGLQASDATEAGGATGSTGGVLVAYFSATGNTEGIAEAIAVELGADTFEIEPAEPYTDDDLNYRDDASRASLEVAEDARPELAQLTPDGWDGYDTVLLGYPIWWGEAACPARTFAAGNDFSGKAVVPFCTSGSSSIGGSGERLAEIAGTGAWRDGARFSAGAGEDAAAWASELAL